MGSPQSACTPLRERWLQPLQSIDSLGLILVIGWKTTWTLNKVSLYAIFPQSMIDCWLALLTCKSHSFECMGQIRSRLPSRQKSTANTSNIGAGSFHSGEAGKDKRTNANAAPQHANPEDDAGAVELGSGSQAVVSLPCG